MSRKLKKKLFRILLSAFLFAAGLMIPHSELSLVLLTACYLLIGLDVLKEAAEGIFRGQIFDENFLMAIATIGAFIIGEYHEAAAVMLFYQIGEWFQQYAVGRSRASITQLMNIRPDIANVEREGEILAVDPEEVSVGDIMVIRPGERIPLDGIVLEGSSAIDTSALTGESLPRDVSSGDEVISGCINRTGLLRVQANKVYTDSTVAKILDLVENASDQKARIEGFITRFARIYTPLVCGIALLLFLLPTILFGGNWKDWGYRALSFLVVSCPCALVISVPLSFFGGIGCASRCGILIKGSNYIEVLAKTETVLLDKTGTLTEGRFCVSSLHPEGVSKDELLRIAAAAESVSNHPVSRSICAACPTSSEAFSISDVQEIAGEGVIVHIEGTSVAVGNRKLMNRQNISITETDSEGTVVYIARDRRFIGAICVSDKIKDSAQKAIARLRKCGVKKIIMLSGDNESSARSVADKLGLDEAFASLLPAEKVACAERFLAEKDRRGSLIFAGDGINDAPLLMRADAGVAMGAMGSDAAVEAADVVLMDDDPSKLALAIAISRRTVAIARQNIVFALVIKIAVLMLTGMGLTGMWLAVFADVGVSVLAILNAMRALQMPRVQ